MTAKASKRVGIVGRKKVVDKVIKGLKKASKLHAGQAKSLSALKLKKGGKVKKKKSFPDVSGDGKITKKDILMARGVIPKTKNGMKKKRK